jgi:hypothetical protein
LFIVKYGENYNVPLLIGYLIVLFGLSIFYVKIHLKDLFYKSFFWIGVILFFFFSIYLNYKVDGNSLNVDRWSAMEILSPSYLWEVYVKSDLFSNFIIIAGFTYLIWSRFLKEKAMKSEFVSFLAALILLTRLSSVIPLTILLFKRFYDFSIKEKISFLLVFIVTVSITVYLFFHNVPNLDVFMKHNPFMIQGAKQPLLLSISYIAVAFILSFKVKSFYETIFWSGTLLFICVFVPFLMFFVEYGYTDMITNSFFDLSFFNMCMPFVMITLVWGIFKNNIKN